MSSDQRRPGADLRCPHCGGTLWRVRRNPFDRLVSLLAPRRRYRCRTLGCGWSGTLPYAAGTGIARPECGRKGDRR